MTELLGLPPGVTVFERGWLSANNIFFLGRDGSALIDSSYCTHSEQTLALVAHALGGRQLDRLLNTHLHSDHCGGNAALQQRYPHLQTLIPPGAAAHVKQWDPDALTYVATGQNCPRFQFTGLLQPGTETFLGDRPWQIHASPGHDAHSVILFEPECRTLISADTLWENGFGVIFQELEGENAFDEVAGTLDLIDSLEPAIVIPGHGKVFKHVGQSLAAARRRLDSFVRDPQKHAVHASKVLLKFKLLQLQRSTLPELTRWAALTPYFGMVQRRWFSDITLEVWIEQLADGLARSGAARREGDFVFNA